MEVSAPAYDNFVFGNILDGELEDFAQTPPFLRASSEMRARCQGMRGDVQIFFRLRRGKPGQ